MASFSFACKIASDMVAKPFITTNVNSSLGWHDEEKKRGDYSKDEFGHTLTYVDKNLAVFKVCGGKRKALFMKLLTIDIVMLLFRADVAVRNKEAEVIIAV